MVSVDKIQSLGLLGMLSSGGGVVLDTSFQFFTKFIREDREYSLFFRIDSTSDVLPPIPSCEISEAKKMFLI